MIRQSSYFVTTAPDEEQRQYQVETLENGRYRVITPGGEELVVDAFEPAEGQLHLLCNERSIDVDVRANSTSFAVQLTGETHQIEVLNERQKRMIAAGAGAKKGGGPDLQSPMAGKVVAITTAVGDTVVQGQILVIVEAMKMENDLKAHKEGTIAQIHIRDGQAVEIGDVLVTIEE